MLKAKISVEVLIRVLAEDNLCAESLAEYDRRWRSLLGREIEVVCVSGNVPAGPTTPPSPSSSTSPTATASSAVQSHRLFDWHAPLLSALLDGPLSLLHFLGL